STPLPDRELQMLEMMRNILGVDNSHMGGRSQRSSASMAYAASVPYEDSLPEEASDSTSFFDDLDDSDECNGYGSCLGDAAKAAAEPLLPCARPLLPMEHPCFVRVIVLRTPLLSHDPCTNYSLGMASTTTSTTQRPRPRQCKPKQKTSTTSAKSHSTSTTNGESMLGSAPVISEESTSAESTINSSTSSSTSTSTSTSSTTTEEPTTTTESTTDAPTTSTTTPRTTTTTTSARTTVEYSKQHQLKSLRGRRRKAGKKRPSVPDTPKINVDSTMQPSDTFPVFQTTEAGELRLRPETHKTTTPRDAETSAADCVEDVHEMEATREHDESKAKAGEKETEGKLEESFLLRTERPQNKITTLSHTKSNSNAFAGSGDCEDAEDQNTNLCPKFSNPEEPENMRLMPSSRYRKPVKNYVEPILYEGQFAKPRQRIGVMSPQQRDYYLSNKQIMPRPRPRYREPLPHSVYMNNIVRGIKCSDEVGSLSPLSPLSPLSTLSHPTGSRRYRGGKLVPQRVWLGRRNGQGGGYVTVLHPQGQALANPRARGNPLYALGSGEDGDSYGHDSDQYYDDGSGESRPWSSREKHGGHPTSSNSDPCQAEH
ncbi:hypothetical protein KR222_011187, partial [Zaprionus bogoriensis]